MTQPKGNTRQGKHQAEEQARLERIEAQKAPPPEAPAPKPEKRRPRKDD